MRENSLQTHPWGGFRLCSQEEISPLFRLKINTEGLWQRTQRKVIHSGWNLGQLTEEGHRARCPSRNLLVWFISGPLCLVHYSLDHSAPGPAGIVSQVEGQRGSQKLFPVSMVGVAGALGTVVVLGMGGEGWNRPSLGLSHRTETPLQPHPIAASQEAREGLEIPFPV